jgi:hypothetical protein
MGKTWKDKNKWEKKHEEKNIKKTKTEHARLIDGGKKNKKKFDSISIFEWHDYDNY